MRKTFASALLAVFVLATAGIALSACNTTAGLGEDMSSAGHSLTNKAQEEKGY